MPTPLVCPCCVNPLVKRYQVVKKHVRGQGNVTTFYQLNVCLHCRMAVRLHRLPKNPRLKLLLPSEMMRRKALKPT